MLELIIVRGLPGSGKSTYVRNAYPLYSHFEADMFFETYEGKYNYVGEFIKTAHDWCYSNVVKSLLIEKRNCVVSNTFTRLFEMEKYIELKNKIPELNIHAVEMKTQFENIHDVPMDVMLRMKARWEEIPKHWDIPVQRFE